MEKLLTIGLACYEDYDGAFFTIQALRMYHPICNTSQVEFIILDNNPKGKSSKALEKLAKHCNGKYIPISDRNSSFVKYDINKYASGKYIIILDCHVLIVLGGIEDLLNYYRDNPNCKDLVQGPLLDNELKGKYSHWDKRWRGHMYGTWGKDPRMEEGKPFPISMQGMGFLSFELKNWPKINPNFKGFGGEEWYIPEKFRLNGGNNICIPSLLWVHRFDRPNGVPFPIQLSDRIFNYFLGWRELYKDKSHPMIQSIFEHFSDTTPKDKLEEIYNATTPYLKS